MTHAPAAAVAIVLFSLSLTGGAVPPTSGPLQREADGGAAISTLAPLLPVDEAVTRPDFFAFRAQLQAALARRDLDAVLPMISPDVKLSFGGDHGMEGLMLMWRPRAADSELWGTLSQVLALGGTFDGDMFAAPYVYSRWPRDVDPFEHVALVAADVPVRTAPREDAAVLVRGSFDVLPLVRTNTEVEGWTAVRAGNGGTGYVAAALARSPIDYRAFFERRDGRWQMVIFLAGD